MAKLTRIQRLIAENAKARVRQTLQGSFCGDDSWLAKRRAQAARATNLRIVDVVRVEAAYEHVMADSRSRRDWVFGEIIDSGLRA